MEYNIDTKVLISRKHSFIKVLHCPLDKKWNELRPLGLKEDITGKTIDLKRHCISCKKDVVNVSSIDDAGVKALLTIDPNLCVYASVNSQYIHFVGTPKEYSREDTGSRLYGYSCIGSDLEEPIIKTARSIEDINKGAAEGFWPAIRPAYPSKEISQKMFVVQNEDGTIEIKGDYRSEAMLRGKQFWHNPYRPELPFAAYLVPKDMKPGTHVYIPDLIEDIVGEFWNQGDTYRRESGFATWDGKDIILDEIEPSGFLG